MFRAGETSPRAKRFLVTTLLAAGVMTAAIVSTAVVGIGAAGASRALGTPHPATLPAVTIGLILARLYQRASKDRAFVRTGLGGQKARFVVLQ